MVLYMGLYMELIYIWHKKISSEKTWSGFKKLFAEEYHDLQELKCINTTQAGFHGTNMDIKMQYNITDLLENLAMAKTPENMYSPR